MSDEKLNDGYDVVKTNHKAIPILSEYRIVYTEKDGILGFEELGRDLLGHGCWRPVREPTWGLLRGVANLLIEEKASLNLLVDSACDTLSDPVAQIIWGKVQSEIKAAKIPPPGAPVPVLNTKKVKKTKKTKRK